MIFSIRCVVLSVIIAAGMILWMGAVCVPTANANSKLAELERKVADLSLLHQQLKDRMQQAQGLRIALDHQQTQFISEIRLLMKSLDIKNFGQARHHLRIRYNLELLGTVLRYIDELDNKLVLYQNGRDRLGYLRQSAEDDMHMISALNDLKIDALTTQISLMINRYLPEAHNIQIDPQEIQPLSAQSAWDRLINKQ